MIEQSGDQWSGSRPDVGPAQGVHDKDAAEVIGRRVAATLIDMIIMFCLGVALALTVGESTVANGAVSFSLNNGEVFLYIGLVLLYFFICEAVSGQTLGKRWLKLRVMRLDGMPARPAAIATRTLLRLVDWLPFLNLLGFICVLATSRRQRVGDLLAKTVVVRQWEAIVTGSNRGVGRIHP